MTETTHSLTVSTAAALFDDLKFRVEQVEDLLNAIVTTRAWEPLQNDFDGAYDARVGTWSDLRMSIGAVGSAIAYDAEVIA